MKIGTKITIQFNFIVSVLLISFAFAIYHFFSNYAQEEFYTRLKEEATTTARLYSEVEEVTYDLLKKIDQNSANVLPEEKVLIYNMSNKLLYSSMEIDVDEIPHQKLDLLKAQKEITYHEGLNEAYGMVFKGKFENLLVVSIAFDKYGKQKLRFLKYLLIIGVLIAIIITTLLGFTFSKQALSPIAGVIRQVDRITASNLNLRVDEGNAKDEIALLAIKFNKMLERLEAAFDMQKSFVSNASHELRTPLTMLTGEIEVALMNAHLNDESKHILLSLRDDIRELNKLSNGLLELAHANIDVSEIRLSHLRMDEIIGAVRADILKSNKDYKILVNIREYPEDENRIKSNANEQLIKSALYNAIENACKYSNDHTAVVNLDFDQKNILISVMDSGIGISPESMQHIFEPFYRSDNARNIKGHGVGLTLAQRIVHLHNGEIEIKSELGKGTEVLLHIPHL